MQKEIAFDRLNDADLTIDCLYLGGTDKSKGMGNEPLSRLLDCGNQGGFRYLGSANGKLKYVILTSTLAESDWPDFLDDETGRFVYYGDNRTPGSELHDTKKKGNLILRGVFDKLHLDNRKEVPPIFVFTGGKFGRDYEFKGLAVPGVSGLSQTEDLVAVWKSQDGKRFQNYKATFTILDTDVIPRAWLQDLKEGNSLSENCPKAWKDWVLNKKYTPLIAKRAEKHRSREEQLPDAAGRVVIQTIYDYFKDRPHRFEACARELALLMDRNIISCTVTRPTRDGGRDAIGEYRIGIGEQSSTKLDFALEAKLYGINNSVGVRETSRLISRLRFRQFGIFITTSFIGEQAYKEIIEDRHPIIIISAKDIVSILKNAGYDSDKKVDAWLKATFPNDEW